MTLRDPTFEKGFKRIERLRYTYLHVFPQLPRRFWKSALRTMSLKAQQGTWPTVAVMGAGAVGCYFGGMLARAGAPVTLIGRPAHVNAIAAQGLFLDTLHFQQRVPVSASSDISAVGNSQIVLFCVKTLDTETLAKAIAPHLAPGAAVVSLQNGVDNVERIYSAAGMEAIPAVVYVASAMIAPGHVKHSGRGDLIVGDLSTPDRDRARREVTVEPIAAMFERAGVPCRVSENIEADLWTKMIMNCAYNAISALGRARYGRIARTESTRDLMKRVVEEAVAVACAAGVSLSGAAMIEAAFNLGEAMQGALSSTAQDINRGRLTEIDSLNGYVVRRGAGLGVEAPVNQTLHALVKLLEQSAAEYSPQATS